MAEVLDSAELIQEIRRLIIRRDQRLRESRINLVTPEDQHIRVLLGLADIPRDHHSLKALKASRP